MKTLSIILVSTILGLLSCGGRVREVACPAENPVGCEPPYPHGAYCCPAESTCCERDGLFGCCEGDVPGATTY